MQPTKGVPQEVKNFLYVAGFVVAVLLLAKVGASPDFLALFLLLILIAMVSYRRFEIASLLKEVAK